MDNKYFSMFGSFWLNGIVRWCPNSYGFNLKYMSNPKLDFWSQHSTKSYQKCIHKFRPGLVPLRVSLREGGRGQRMDKNESWSEKHHIVTFRDPFFWIVVISYHILSHFIILDFWVWISVLGEPGWLELGEPLGRNRGNLGGWIHLPCIESLSKNPSRYTS